MPLSAQSVEQIGKRTSNAKHYRNPDGTMSAVISSGPIHYKAQQGGQWLDKKQQFKVGPGTNEWISNESDVTMRTYQVGQGGNATWWIQFVETLTGQGVEFQVLGQPSTTAGSNVLTFQDGAGRTWTYTHTRTGGKMWGPPMPSSEPATTYTFNYRLLGGAPALSVNAAGDLVCGSIFTMPRSYMRGANGADYPAGAWVIGSGTVSFTMNHISAGLPAAAYPFQLDPSTTFAVATSGADIIVMKVGSAVYPPNTATTTDTTLDTLYVVKEINGTYQIYVTALSFDTSSLDDAATIAGAILQLANYTSGGFMLNANSKTMSGGWLTGSLDATAYTDTADTSAFSGFEYFADTTLGLVRSIALSGAAANISLTGSTKLRLTLSDGATPTGRNTATWCAYDHATAQEPRLIVNYMGPSVKPQTALAHGIGVAAVASEGYERYDSTRNLGRFYDSVRERAISEMGYQAYAYCIGGGPQMASGVTITNVANGGAIALPVVLPGHMLLQSVSYWDTTSATARGPIEFAIFEDRQNINTTLDLVSGAVGSLASYTPTVASIRTIGVTSPPVYLPPGCYWLVMKNNNAATAWGLGSTAVGTMALRVCQTKTLTTAAFGSTLDLVAATWNKLGNIPVVRLNGRSFGQTAAF